MGVKDLWNIIDSVAEDITIHDLEGKTVAIDLSGWVCDSNAIGQYQIQRPDLRNTFFRTSRLLLSNVTPLFVLEGEAPKIKHATITSRNISRGGSQNTQSTKTKAPRSNFLSRLKPMVKLLDAMGVRHVQSSGEAEKFCAYLNKNKCVDAVISQDSDCFLYGATQVLRNFSVAHGNATARKYCSEKIISSLNLDRDKLVVLALLLGCDYAPKGVPGVGYQQAVAFIKGCNTESALKRVREWRNSNKLIQLEIERNLMNQARSCSDCWHTGTLQKHKTKGCPLCGTVVGCKRRTSVLQNDDDDAKWQIIELQIRSKALQDPDFPSEEIISEFLDDDNNFISEYTLWSKPNFSVLMEIGTKTLGWDKESCSEKMYQLLSRWQCIQLAQHLPPDLPLPLEFKQIIKKRIQNSVRHVEVSWLDNENLVTTLEPIGVFSKAYPIEYNSYEEFLLQGKKKPREKGEKKAKKARVESNKTDVLGKMFESLELDESLNDSELDDIVTSIISRGAQHPK